MGAPQVELEDPVENIGAKLVRQAAAKTNDLAGDGTTTSVVLAQGLIAEGMKVSWGSHWVCCCVLGLMAVIVQPLVGSSSAASCRQQ